MIELPLLPPAMRGLLRDHRGYPVPAENQWTDDGAPELAWQDYRRFFLLAISGYCAICGRPFRPGDHQYRLFADVDAQGAKAFGGSVRSDGPGHRECMLFAAAVCPFFKTPNARARLGNLAGMPRGPRAAVMGFDNVRMHPRRDENGDVRAVEFTYDGLREELWFSTADEVVPHLEEAIADGAPIETEDRLYWTENEALMAEWPAAVQWFYEQRA
ncbi:hypothetical protein [Nocardia africana]|uniref:Uncharacterized protein n=1 Tax=Nocardia africana TaxID=134964 RepID=A0ABW6NEW6_9NOCA